MRLEQAFEESQVEHGREAHGELFVAGGQAAMLLEPADEALNGVALAVELGQVRALNILSWGQDRIEPGWAVVFEWQKSSVLREVRTWPPHAV